MKENSCFFSQTKVKLSIISYIRTEQKNNFFYRIRKKTKNQKKNQFHIPGTQNPHSSRAHRQSLSTKITSRINCCERIFHYLLCLSQIEWIFSFVVAWNTQKRYTSFLFELKHSKSLRFFVICIRELTQNKTKNKNVCV